MPNDNIKLDSDLTRDTLPTLSSKEYKPSETAKVPFFFSGDSSAFLHPSTKQRLAINLISVFPIVTGEISE